MKYRWTSCFIALTIIFSFPIFMKSGALTDASIDNRKLASAVVSDNSTSAGIVLTSFNTTTVTSPNNLPTSITNIATIKNNTGAQITLNVTVTVKRESGTTTPTFRLQFDSLANLFNSSISVTPATASQTVTIAAGGTSQLKGSLSGSGSTVASAKFQFSTTINGVSISINDTDTSYRRYYAK